MPYAIATAAATTAGSPPVAQAIAVDCKGSVPKAVIVMATRGTTLGSHADGAMYSMAFSDGMTTRLGSAMSEDAQAAASADTGIDYDNAAQIVRVLASTSEATDGVADFVSFSNDVVNISWTDLPSTAVQIVVIAFYGTQVQARVAAVACSTTLDGTATVMGTVFRPNIIVHLGARAGFTSTGANADMHFGFTAINEDGTIQGQGGYVLREGDRPALTACHSGIRDDSTGQRITLTTEECRAEVTSGTSDGFVITTRVAGGSAYSFGFLALRTEGRANVGVIDIGTDSAGDKTVSGLSFTPGLVMMIGTGLDSKNAYSTVSQAGNWSFGAAIAPGPGIPSVVQACIGYTATVNAVTSHTHCITDNTKLANVLVDAAHSTDWSATLVSVAPDQFVVNVGTASVAPRYLAYLALEERKGVGWWDAISGRRWRRCLGRR